MDAVKRHRVPDLQRLNGVVPALFVQNAPGLALHVVDAVDFDHAGVVG
jgi:hypothetical protein